MLSLGPWLLLVLDLTTGQRLEVMVALVIMVTNTHYEALIGLYNGPICLDNRLDSKKVRTN